MSSFLEDSCVELSQNYFCASKTGSMLVIQDLLSPPVLIQSINKHIYHSIFHLYLILYIRLNTWNEKLIYLSSKLYQFFLIFSCQPYGFTAFILLFISLFCDMENIYILLTVLVAGKLLQYLSPHQFHFQKWSLRENS